MPVIGTWNFKGGTAKTSTVAALGTCPRYPRRLMIDLDSQGDLALITGAAQHPDYIAKRQSLTSVLCGRHSAQDVLLHLSDGSWFCAGDDSLERLPQLYPSGLGAPEGALRKLLDQTRSSVVTYIDLPPRVSFLVKLGLFAADAVLIPTPLEVQSLAGVSRTVDYLRREVPSVRILGVVRVRVPTATTATKVVAGALDAVCRQCGVPLLQSIVRERTALQRSQITRSSIWTEQTDVVADYGALADEIATLLA